MAEEYKTTWNEITKMNIVTFNETTVSLSQETEVEVDAITTEIDARISFIRK